MEIYVAISDFTPPIVDGSQNILQFEKGDQFEIFDCHKTDADWWGARALKTNTVGYVPSRYMQYEERRVGKLLPNNYKSEKECSLKKLTAIQNDPNQKSPEDMYSEQEEPEPDYHDEVFLLAAGK
ncbi:tyrosine-protein kinase Yes-like [Mya arenaria]|uniref:tyrosine-protein kinase Yes-like n=1 Tax=Mya arenaria TaxID=6604 RepID=UPI0022DEC6CE|nr:tyrosine-protein kinase Yes-like [Mya arenaria]